MIERDFTTFEEVHAELIKQPGAYLWDDHNGAPKICSFEGQVDYEKVQIPWSFALRLLKEADVDTPTNKVVYLVAPWEDRYGGRPSAAGVSVYDNVGWLHSFHHMF